MPRTGSKCYSRQPFSTALAVSLAACFIFIDFKASGAGLVEHRNVAFDISPDGEQVAFSSADGDLYLLNLKTSQVRQLAATDAIESRPRFSPDGKSVIYASRAKEAEADFICVRSLETNREQQLTASANASDSDPAYSSDGHQIVFMRAHRHRRYSLGGWIWDDWDVYVMNYDGTKTRRLSHEKSYSAGRPWFSKDGKTVLYTAQARGEQAETTIYETNASGNQPPKELATGRRERASHGAWASNVAVSRDSAFIAFISDRSEPYRYDVFIANRDGSQPRALGALPVSRYNQAPNFMPDGKSVMFLAGREFNAGSRAIYSLWLVDSDGKNARQIADSELFTNPRRWKPKP